MLIAGGYTARLAGRMAKVEGEISDRLGQLSTGSRILKAADDPAGLAIATGLRVRVRSREMAIRNTEDGLGMADLADAGLSMTAGLLSRMRELAVQSSSETLSDSERRYVQDEFEVLLDEVDRTAQSLLYNGETVISPPGVDVGLLIDASGSMGGEKAQVTSQIQGFIDQFVAARYNVRVGAVAYAITKDPVDNVELQAQLGASDITAAIGALALGVGPVDPYAAMTEVTGITRINGTAEQDRLAFRQSAVKMLVLVSDAKRSADLNGMVESEVAAALAEQEYQLHAITPASVLFDYDDIISETGGGSYSIGDASGSGIAAALDAIATAAIDALDNSETVAIHTGPGVEDRLSTPFPLDASTLGLDIADISVDTVDAARAAIDRLSAATQTLGGLRGQVGSAQRRLSHTLARNVSALEAEVAAESRITDQDHAVAVTALAAAQLRQQSLIGAAAVARQADREQAERLLS